MADLNVIRDTELEVVHVEAQTDDAVEFIDAWNETTMQVLDSGRVILPLTSFHRLTTTAREAGLTIGEDA